VICEHVRIHKHYVYNHTYFIQYLTFVFQIDTFTYLMFNFILKIKRNRVIFLFLQEKTKRKFVVKFVIEIMAKELSKSVRNCNMKVSSKTLDG